MPRKAFSQGPGLSPEGADSPEPVQHPSLPLEEGIDTINHNAGIVNTGTEVGDDGGVPQDNGQPAEATGATGRRRSTAAPQPPQTIGEALRRARDAAGLTLDDVAERTKVRPGILREIDADAHDRLPALTYSLGFVKAYARTVGMDPAAAAEQYRRESMKGDPVPTMIDLQPLEEKRLPTRKVVAATTGGLVLLLLLFWAWGAGWFDGSPPAAPGVSPEARVEAEVAAEALPGAVEVTPAPPVNRDAPVTLAAREEVWLRISDGNQTFFMGTMAPGQVLTLPQGRDWLLRTGRAGALDVKVGTTAVPPLGPPAGQVRDLSLKPGDLLARPVPAAGGLAPRAD